MGRPVPLSTKLGELMGPQTFVTAVVIGPDGTAQLDPGALHGRSELESRYQFVQKRELVEDARSCWIVWVALEMEAANQPRAYKGLSVSGFVIDLKRRVAYKSLSQHVNQMSNAMQGSVAVDQLTPHTRQLVKDQLLAISPQLWERSPEALKQALTS